MKKPALYAALDEVFRMYNGDGFTISDVYADNQFKPIMDEIKDELEIDMHYSPAKGDQPQAERNNRFLKERIRAAYHRLPYKALPIKVMKVLVMDSARKPNFFPNKYGISKYFSPRQLLHRLSLDYDKHCKYYLGQYVQAHDEPEPRNSQQARTIDALYLRPVAGGHEVYNLATDSIITRVKVTPLPVPQHVIDTVNRIADRQHQKGLRITAYNGRVLYDSAWTAGVDYESDDSDDEGNPKTVEEQNLINVFDWFLHVRALQKWYLPNLSEEDVLKKKMSEIRKYLQTIFFRCKKLQNSSTQKCPEKKYGENLRISKV